MPGAIHELLAANHRRLEELLARITTPTGALNLKAYREFRAGLLRHIAMEEKVLIPWAQLAREGKPLEIASKLRLDHGALTALLVLPPAMDVIAALRAVLSDHNALEEGGGGLYSVCDDLAGEASDELVNRLHNVPFPRLKMNVSSPIVLDAARRALTRAGYDWDELVSRSG